MNGENGTEQLPLYRVICEARATSDHPFAIEGQLIIAVFWLRADSSADAIARAPERILTRPYRHTNEFGAELEDELDGGENPANCPKRELADARAYKEIRAAAIANKPQGKGIYELLCVND